LRKDKFVLNLCIGSNPVLILFAFRIDDTPLEASLAFTCKLKSETNFLGRSAVEKQKKEGVKKRKVALTLDDDK
jgi:glycine cleavage system aminomethyltransferase T